VACGDTVYLVSIAPIIRDRAGIGDAATLGESRLGILAGGTEVGAPTLLASLGEQQLGEGLIWVDVPWFIRACLPVKRLSCRQTGPHANTNSATRRTSALQPRLTSGQTRFRLGLLSPLDPLKATLIASVMTVAGIGALVVAATFLMLSFLANRMLRPIAQLRKGAARIGAGDLGHRILVRTGDEDRDFGRPVQRHVGKAAGVARQPRTESGRTNARDVQLFGEVQARIRELEQARLRRFLAPQVAGLLLPRVSAMFSLRAGAAR
jgi:hypothetical protein